MSIEIRLAQIHELADVVDHDLRHFKEPGFNNQLVHPFPLHFVRDREKMIEERLGTWQKAVTEERWARSFIIIENGLIVGHLNLKNLFQGTMHRAQLGMGLEMEARNRGLGRKLLQMSVDWSKEQPSLEWIDLSVFSHNLPARKLYTSFGFTELYNKKDAIRVEGVSIDDVQMALKLRN